MPRLTHSLPKYSLHKRSGQAVVDGTRLRRDGSGEQCLASCRKQRLHGGDVDHAGDVVAARADRRDARGDARARHLRRIDVAERRVHVVATGRGRFAAVHADLDAVVGQAAQHRQAGHAAGPVARKFVQALIANGLLDGPPPAAPLAN